MEYDPNFPNRPTHKDFERLSEAIISNDKAVEDHVQDDDHFYRYVARFVDPDSAEYMAQQRGLRLARLLTQVLPEEAGEPAQVDTESKTFRLLQRAAAMAWLDGLMCALRSDFPTILDGQHRTGRLQ